jgi:hypothetical protein
MRKSKTGGALIIGLTMAVLGLSTCSGGKAGGGGGSPLLRPSSSAQLEIVSPTNGEVVKGTSVELRVSLAGAKLVPTTTTDVRPDEGHLHVFLDDQIVSMTFGLDQQIPVTAPGQHVLRVEFVAADHEPFDPRVFVSVVFEVQT